MVLFFSQLFEASAVKNFKLILSTVILIFFSAAVSSARNGEGIITGKVIDANTGDPLIGARVMLKDKSKGAMSKIDGSFRIAKVQAGTYTLEVNYVGYATTKIRNVEVKSDDIFKIDIRMKEEAVMTEEVVVQARAYQNTEAALLKERQKSEAFSDAISAEDISRGGSGDAADAIKKVTGATTVGGKHVYIRGLGDRYSSTQLNGANLPTADPDKKSVHLDLFPSNLIENITTIKTATPDKPGDFTGGTVDIRTKSFPEKFKMKYSMSSAYNTATTGEDFLTYPGSGTDWLGYDNGKRDIPGEIMQVLNNPDDEIPYVQDAYNKDNSNQAYKLQSLSRAFDPVMHPTKKTAPMDRSFSFSIGDNLFDQKFGYLASISYKRNFKSYTGGTHAIYLLPGRKTDSAQLVNEVMVTDNKSDDEVIWGSMLNLAYNVSPNHQVGVNFMYNQSGISTARYQDGWDRYYDSNYETRVLQYTERNMNSLQFNGRHNFDFMGNAKMDWNVAYSKNSQHEPDLRFFTNEYYIDEDDQDTTYEIDQSLYKYPSRYFRDLNEDITSATADIEVPFKDIMDFPLKLKTGFSYRQKNRDFREQRFDMEQDDVNYNGDPNGFFEDYTGIVDSSRFYRFGNYISYYNPDSSSYNGQQEITALYGMIDWQVYELLRVVGGVRYETTQMDVWRVNKQNEEAMIDESDVLPSINLIYTLTENMNVRGAFGKTIARPMFREIAPYSSFEYVGGYILLGNPELERTMINNYDIRWEWFQNPGEILAASAFYKDFDNPIERTIINVNDEVQYKNVDQAQLFGAEFEFRKKLGFINEIFNDFLFGVNFTYVYSEVDIPDEEWEEIKAFDSTASRTRDLQGQSPYILNLDLSYVNWDSGTEANLHYYVFGKRLSDVTQQGTPDIYEYPRPDLNLVISQKFFNRLKVRLTAKNILNSNYEKGQEFNGKKYITQDYRLGRIFKIGVSYAID
jgi:TonB-dependent receptor